MQPMNRSALLWAGLLATIFTLTGCPSPGPSDPCQQNPASCVDGGMMCTPTGDESAAANNCDDGVDNDCDGYPDAIDPECANTCVVSGPENLETPGSCSDSVDNDCDGFADSGDSGCNNTCPGYQLENTMSLCTDGVDNDCNGSKDNEDPGMDPNCEPMSCTPGVEPGPDGRETIHRPDECYDGSWVDEVVQGGTWTFAMIMDEDKTWSCCRVDNPLNCFTSSMNYSPPQHEGYEAGASFGGGYAIERDRTIVQYQNESNNSVLVFAANGASATFTRTTNGVETIYTCQ